MRIHMPIDGANPYDSGSICGIPANRLSMNQIAKSPFESSCGSCARIRAARYRKAA